MQIFENKIVFSNDIYKILKGYNSLDYNYESNGIIVQSKNFIEKLRNDFKNTTNNIFEGNIEIVTEEQMQSSIKFLQIALTLRLLILNAVLS